MADVDSISISISAKATQAVNSLDKLINRLGTVNASLNGLNSKSLSNLANSVSQLSVAMNSINTAKTADFTRLAKNISQLSNINASGLNNAASSLHQISNALGSLGNVSAQAQQMTLLSDAISRLGYKSVTTAITNIPLLATSMRELMETLSKAPKVSQNLIDMTNALAGLAAQGSRVGSAGRGMASTLNSFSYSARNAKKHAKSLTSAIGKFYATWFIALRGIKTLWKDTKSSMNYIESLNYFEKAFDQVAENADLSSFKELGYGSAEEYAKSFEERAKKLTAQMTGFNVNSNGTLSATGGVSLGIDPNQVMQYQAMFGQMASSMGVASETSVKLSRALTEIGADLASVKNLDFEKVWTDMASGLAGMSRTLDKYGVNIRNVNMQQKLNELGIQANITALNQNEKALLRATILLDSTKYSWADMAETLNTSANMLRLLSSNSAQLGRTIGNLFLPMVQKLLPYVNGLVISLQRLFVWVGNILGIDLSSVTGSVGDTGDAVSDLLGDTDEFSDGLGDAADNAKKLKQQLSGIDELNNLTSNTKQDKSSGVSVVPTGALDSAFDDAYNRYQKVWDEAFGSLENRAQQLADRFDTIFEPVKDIIGAFAVGDFFTAGGDVSALASDMMEFVSNAIASVDWTTVGKKIGSFISGVDFGKIAISLYHLGDSIVSGIADAIDGILDKAPIEASIAGLFLALKYTGVATNISNKIKSVLEDKGIKIGNITVGISLAAVGWKLMNKNKMLSKIAGVVMEAVAAYTITANPIIAIGTGVVGALFEALKAVTWDETYDPRIETRPTFVIREDVQKAIDEAMGAFDNFNSKAEETAGKLAAVKEISEEYYNLSKNYNDLTDEQKTLVSNYADILKESLNGATEFIDPITGAWKSTKDELDGLIKSQEQYYITLAAKDSLVEAYKGTFELKKQYKALREELNKKLNTSMGDDDDPSATWSDMLQSMEDNFETIFKNANETKEEFHEFMVAFEEAGYSVDNLDIKNKAIYAAVYKRVATFRDFIDEVGETAKNYGAVQEALKESEENISYLTEIVATNGKAWEDSEGSIEKYLETSNGGTEKSAETVKKAIEDVQTVVGTVQTKVETTLNNLAKKGTTSGNTLITNFGTSFSKITTKLKDPMKNLKKYINEKATSIGNAGGKKLLENFHSGMESEKNTLKTKFENLLTFKGSVVLEADTSKLNSSGLTFAEKYIPIQAHAAGGFPEDGLFFANHNELVGKFSNGKTAVANNQQITQGIADAVYPAVYNAMATAMSNSKNGNGETVVNIDGREVFRATQKYADDYYKRTGNAPYAFAR